MTMTLDPNSGTNPLPMSGFSGYRSGDGAAGSSVGVTPTRSISVAA